MLDAFGAIVIEDIEAPVVNQVAVEAPKPKTQNSAITRIAAEEAASKNDDVRPVILKEPLKNLDFSRNF